MVNEGSTTVAVKTSFLTGPQLRIPPSACCRGECQCPALVRMIMSESRPIRHDDDSDDAAQGARLRLAGNGAVNDGSESDLWPGGGDTTTQLTVNLNAPSHRGRRRGIPGPAAVAEPPCQCPSLRHGSGPHWQAAGSAAARAAASESAARVNRRSLGKFKPPPGRATGGQGPG